MRTRSKRFLSMVAAFFVLFTLSFTTFTVSADPATLHYTALGDSVTFGMSSYHPAPPPAYFGYADMLAEKLNVDGPMAYVNAGAPGIDSTGLFMRVKYCPINRPLVKGRDLVTINIGGNNLLKPFIASIFAAYGVAIDGEIDDPEIAALVMNLQKLGPAEAAAVYESLGHPKGPLASAFKLGVQTFRKDFPRIIGAIKQLAPNSKIIVNNLYNPLKPEDPLYPFVNTYIRQINTTILNLSEDGRFIVTDVYNAFKSYEGFGNPVLFDPLGALSCALAGDMVGFALRIDPHPNVIGHGIILELQLQAYSSSF